MWKIEVSNRHGIFDAVGAGVKKDASDLGIRNIKDVSFIQVYYLEGQASTSNIDRICRDLLTDPITQEYNNSGDTIHNSGFSTIKHCVPGNNYHSIEIAYNPGVMDPVEESALKGIRDLGIKGITSVKTSKKYLINGKLAGADLNKLCDKLLCNKSIQHVVREESPEILRPARGGAQDDKSERMTVSHIVDLLTASDKALLKISKSGQLFLNLTEMKVIKAHFKKLRRNPTDCELETIAQTWSEHCSHKTLRGKIEYREGAKKVKIDNLLKSTIFKVTKELNKSWCVSVFKDNSGVIKFDGEDNVCFKVETHNHPSALEPYGGANTGLGGVIRDPMGTGLGAKPIANTDVFCFGPPDYPFGKLPKGTLHPKRIMKGVVSGVRDYGNRMGIPTVNGAILFDEAYVGNPLVYCGNVGIMPKDKCFKKIRPGDLVVVAGGKTGRDGIHGATFSSGELTHESEVVSGGAVQIGNAITEKKMLDCILKARDENLYLAITDCGAGGLSSAVGELGAECGARVDLEKVPLKYAGLTPTEIWISEAQERMVLSVPKENIGRFLEIFKNEDVDATIIGEWTNDKRLKLFYKGEGVCDLSMHFLHEGLPKLLRKAVWNKPAHKAPRIPKKKDLTGPLLKILSSLNVASKEWVIRQYDHEVQAGSVLKPLVGINNDGPSDAAIVRPKLSSKRGVIISNGINPRYGLIDPYWMAAANIDEALRQIIAVGGNLKQVAILDNFCWGNTDKPDRLGSLTRAAFGCYDVAKGFGVPFISGKDSLNNEYNVHGKSIAIPGTLLISAIAVMEDISNAVSMDMKGAGNLIYLVGDTKDELGGSEYYKLFGCGAKRSLPEGGCVGNSVPTLDVKKSKRIMNALSSATAKHLVRACHDLSEGGLAVALSEMCFAGGLGAEVFLGSVPRVIARSGEARSLARHCEADGVSRSNLNDGIGTGCAIPEIASPSARNDVMNDTILFSESNTRFLVEVEKKHHKEFEKAMRGAPLGLIGCVSDRKKVKVYGLKGEAVVDSDIAALKEAWQRPLRW